MQLREIVKQLDLQIIAGANLLEREATGCYVSDMLSDVMAHANSGDVWVTLQVHLNIIAVASVNGISALIIVNDRSLDDATIKKATEEKVPVLVTTLNAFQIAGKLYQLGLGEKDA
ncbi:MAG: serine kinase [Candidatus Marinimicrobia bacterium]|nr:serine kinase [Candidatus Neomarinimicrobiota bacterium]